MNLNLIHRKLIGYRDGNKRQPIYAPMAGALVTRAVMLCHKCLVQIYHSNGPQLGAWCPACTEDKIAQDNKTAKQDAIDKENEIIRKNKIIRKNRAIQKNKGVE